MTKVEELIQYFNTAYGTEDKWPKTFEVSAELYGKCCQTIFNNFDEPHLVVGSTDFFSLALGSNRGLMFKNVELRIKNDYQS